MSRSKVALLSGAIIALGVFVVFKQFQPSYAGTVSPRQAPEFNQTSSDAWLNSEPLTLEGLRGNVVMLDIWTFDCWNCYRSFPWLNALEKRLEGEDFKVIGIHTPEFEHEKVRANIEEKIKKYNLTHPSMMDNDFAYWKALGNRYWPSFYLIDKKGNIRYLHIGEMHEGDKRALAVERDIQTLLSES